MYWWNTQVKICTSTIADTSRVILKPSPGLGRLRVVGLASQLVMDTSSLYVERVSHDIGCYMTKHADHMH